MARQLVVSNDVAAEFEVQKNHVNIFHALSNFSENNPSLKYFFYAPVLLLIRCPDGTLKYDKLKLPGGKFMLRFYIQLFGDEFKTAAFERLKSAFSHEASAFSRDRVAPLPLQTVHVKAYNLPNKVFLGQTDYHFFNQQDELALSFIVEDESVLKEVPDIFDAVRISFRFDLVGTKVDTSTINVTGEQLIQTDLYAMLNGTSLEFIHRDDFRRLLVGVSKTLKVTGVVRNPEAIDLDIITKAVNIFFDSQDAEKVEFTNNMLASTFNASDLNPDTISRQLNKLFTFDEGDKMFHVNKETYNQRLDEQEHQKQTSVSAQTQLPFDLMAFKFGGSNSHSASDKFHYGLTENSKLSDLDIKRELKKHDIQAEVEGNMIVVKKVDVTRCNVSKFNSGLNLGQTMVHASDSIMRFTHDIEMFADRSTPSIVVRPQVNLINEAEALVKTAVPLGTILTFSGVTAPPNYLLCNGEEVSKEKFQELYYVIGNCFTPTPKPDTFNLPNLSHRFVRGMDIQHGSQLGQMGGQTGHSLIPAELPPHSHSGRTDVTHIPHNHPTYVSEHERTHYVKQAGEPQVLGVEPFHLSTDIHPHKAVVLQSDPAHFHTFTTDQGTGLGRTPFSIEPPYITLNFIIKAK